MTATEGFDGDREIKWQGSLESDLNFTAEVRRPYLPVKDLIGLGAAMVILGLRIAIAGFRRRRLSR